MVIAAACVSLPLENIYSTVVNSYKYFGLVGYYKDGIYKEHRLICRLIF